MAFIDPDAFVDPDEADQEAIINSKPGRMVSALPSGIETAGRMIAQTPAYLGGAIAGSVAGVLGGDVGRGMAVKDAVMESPLTNPVTMLPQSDKSQQMDEMISKGLEWLKEQGGEAALLAKKFGTGALPIGSLFKFLPEHVVRGFGEATTEMATNLIPFGEAKLAQNIRNNRAAGQVTPQERAFLEGKRPVVEQPSVSGPEALEMLNQRPEAPSSLSMETPEQLATRVQEPVVENPVAQMNQVLRPTEEALISPEVDAQRIAKMEDNTKVNEVRADFPSIDFPLRQEMLDSPEIRHKLDQYQRWIDEATQRGETQFAEGLRQEFGQLMRDYGVDKPSDAYGRALFESGVETKLPIEKTDRPALPSESGRGWTAVIDEKPLALEPISSRTGRGRQRGAVDYNIFGQRGKEIPLDGKKEYLERSIAKLNTLLESREAQREGTRSLTERAQLSKDVNDLRSELSLAQSQLRRIDETLSKPKAEVTPFVPRGERGMIRPNMIGDLIESLRTTKLKDAEGFPKLFYHGTSKDVPFKDIKANRNGAWFTTKPDSASDYARTNDSQGYTRDGYKLTPKNTSSRVMPVYLDMKNPKVLTREENQKFHNSRGGNYKQSQRDYIDKAKREGHDGLISEDGELAVAFNSEQIHSALSPKSGFVPKKERGSLGDPEFLKFKNELPESMKKRANVLWKEYQKMQKEPVVETTPGSKVEQALVNIPGVASIIDEVAPIAEVPMSELLPRILTEPDISSSMMASQLSSGAQMRGFATKSTAIRYVGDVAVNAWRKADVAIKDLLLNPETGLKTKLEKLSTAEQAQLHASMLKQEGKDRTITHPTDAMQEAHSTYRKVMDQALTAVNKGRERLGMKPIEGRPNYMPSRWRGDFSIPVFDKDGTTVTFITAPNKWAAKTARTWMQENHPEFNFGEVQYRPISRQMKDVEGGFREMMQLFESDDPRAATIQEAFEGVLAQKGLEYQNFKRHMKFKRKEGAGGFQGGKPWYTPEQNAKEGFEAAMKYAEQAFRWSEMQEATAKVKELRKNLPEDKVNTANYIKSYWDNVSGHGTAVSRAIDSIVDSVAETVGVGRTTLTDTSRLIKSAMTLKFLGFFNASFLASQAYQPVQMLPHWMSYLHGRGGANPLISGAKASMDLVSPLDQMTPEGKAAYEYGVKNHIFDSFIIDDIRTVSTKPWLDAADAVVRWAPTKIEGISRASFYMNIFHQLHESGIRGKQAHETAAKITDMGMTNYMQIERPLIYQQLGAIGDMASALTTFKHNQYNQLAAFGKEGRRRNLLPMVLSQLVAGGMLGFYARDELDAIIDTMNNVFASLNTNMPYIPNTKEMLLKSGAPNGLVFGGVSTVTGLDMSSRFSAANVIPDGVSEMILPFLNDIKSMAEGLAGWAANRTGESGLKALHAILPSSMKAIAEEAAYPQDPRTGLGQYKRGVPERLARAAASYTIDESKQRMATWELKKENAWNEKVRDNTLARIKQTEDPDKLRELVNRYISVGGDITSLQNSLKRHQIGKLLTPFEREQGISPTTTNKALKFQRALEYKD